jgi:hypothetical protein
VQSAFHPALKERSSTDSVPFLSKFSTGTWEPVVNVDVKSSYWGPWNLDGPGAVGFVRTYLGRWFYLAATTVPTRQANLTEYRVEQ